MKRIITWVMIIAFVGGAATCGALWSRSSKKGNTNYRTALVRQGDLAETIGATGTVEPEDLIDVGAQVAGRITEFGKDRSGAEIDYGSEIKAGAVMARIDDTVYRAQMEQAEAALNSAYAGLDRARADLLQLTAKNNQARGDWERAQKLGPSDALSLSAYEGYRSAASIAEASLQMGKAAIRQAEASIVQAKADLNRANQNLSYCTITSPVDGIIIDRRVNIGQTVVASLNAPSLFLIAKDLKRVQVWVAVNEADIGNIHPGQRATFTVDAYPDEQFQGRVGKIRLNASMTQNVVTYTVEVATDNSDGRLLPYLTANMLFETSRKDNVLLVPSQALKWTPPDEAAKQAKDARQQDGSLRADRVAASSSAKGSRDQGSGKGTVWIPDGANVRPVQVRIGIRSGTETEVSGPDIKAGMAVVIGTKSNTEKEQPKGSTNPFVPQLPNRGGKRH